MSVFGRFSVAIVTPFDQYIDQSTQRQNIDEKSLIKLVETVATGLNKAKLCLQEKGRDGNLIGGIICSGTTGEQHSMNFGERVLLYEIVSRICKNIGCPFAVGVSATSLEDVTALAMKGVEVGCDGIMLGLPPYLRLCQEEIIHYVESVRSVVPHRIPILLYNNVTRNSYGASAETLVYLHQQGIIWGVKHASPEFAQDCDNLFGLDPSIKLYTGSDVLIKNLMTIGDHKFYGLTSILGNIFPTELAEMIADFVFSDGEDTGLVSHKNMTRRQVLLQELSDAILLGCTLPVGVKYALKLRGVPGGDSRRPIGFLSDSKKLEIEIQVNKFLEFTTSET